MSTGVAQLLERFRSGDQGAFNELVNALYGELQRIASAHLRAERPGHTLQATALVHEAYLKLLGDTRLEIADSTHFLSVASRVMRQVLVDYARGRAAKKRSAEPLLANEAGEWHGADVLDLDAAVESLAKEDPRLAQIVEMRYFGGLTAEEIAAALGRSVHVVRHDLRFARAALRKRLARG